MNLPNKKQFISNAKRAASNYRRQRRKLERQNDENENGAHPDDLEEYKLDAYEFLGVLKATFDIMGWGEIPKMLTRNLEPNFY